MRAEQITQRYKTQNYKEGEEKGKTKKQVMVVGDERKFFFQNILKISVLFLEFGYRYENECVFNVQDKGVFTSSATIIT